MHPKRAGFGKICSPCIQNALQIAVGEYTRRISCQGGALFAAQTPQIMHSAQILPCMIAPAERILLGKSCHAIGPVVRISPRFAADDSVVILGSLHAGQDAPSPFQPLDPKTPKLKPLNPNHQGNTRSPSASSRRRFGGWQPRFRLRRIQQLPLR